VRSATLYTVARNVIQEITEPEETAQSSCNLSRDTSAHLLQITLLMSPKEQYHKTDDNLKSMSIVAHSVPRARLFLARLVNTIMT
jgi:hypothetical protein